MVSKDEYIEILKERNTKLKEKLNNTNFAKLKMEVNNYKSGNRKAINCIYKLIDNIENKKVSNRTIIYQLKYIIGTLYSHIPSYLENNNEIQMLKCE